jgi:hypothetical protein
MMDLILLGIFDEIAMWWNLLGWLWLVVLAYFYYAWARDHLFFSPMLVLVFGAILIYYLVIENPILGTIGLFGYTLLFGGILYLLPLVIPFFKRRN